MSPGWLCAHPHPRSGGSPIKARLSAPSCSVLGCSRPWGLYFLTTRSWKPKEGLCEALKKEPENRVLVMGEGRRRLSSPRARKGR